MTKKILFIVGSGGHGRVVAEIAELNNYDVVFLSDDFPGTAMSGVWQIEDKIKECESEVFCAIGHNLTRKKIVDEFSFKLSEPLKHPMSIVSSYASVGVGSLIGAGAILNPFCTVGEGTVINTGAIVEHDCTVGNFAHISPGAKLAGGVSVEDLSWVGLGAVVREGVKIGRNSIIGCGAVVLKDVESNTTVVGNPAKVK